MDSPPQSPLSEMESDDIHSEGRHSPIGRIRSISPFPEARPAKRQRTSNGTGRNNKSSAAKSQQRQSQQKQSQQRQSQQQQQQQQTQVDADKYDDPTITVLGICSDVDISSDTEGSIPGSLHGMHTFDDEDDKQAAGGREQISVCRWEGCEAGDQKNMDLLVRHLHEEHIHARQKKYSCEWVDCTRKGIAHASGYALRAHMRSHTREKPFYCTLPECDRSFTRSDALAKHMRTVHETEALRPSDPVPKHHSSNPCNKPQRIKLTFNKFATGASKGDNDDGTAGSRHGKHSPPSPVISAAVYDADHDQHYATFTRNEHGVWIPDFPPDIVFSDRELALAASQLYALLKYQLNWVEEEHDELENALVLAEKRRNAEWMAKEMVLHEVLQRGKANLSLEPECPDGLATLQMAISVPTEVADPHRSKAAQERQTDEGYLDTEHANVS